MKRQLTRKLSTAEFAHSHSGHGPPPNVARSWFNVGAAGGGAAIAPTPRWRMHLPAPWTVHIHTCLSPISIGGLPRPPPPASLQSPPGAALPLARSGSEAWAEGDGAWRFVAGATAEGGGGEARENFQDGHPLWPPAHQPGSGGFQRSTFGDTVVHHYRHVPVSSLESSRPPRSPSGCGGSSSAWRV